MARLPSAAELQRRTNARLARETAINTRRAAGRPAGATVNRRGPNTQVYYRSLFRKTSATDHVIYGIKEPTANLTAVGGASAVGLKTELAVGEMSMGSTRREVRPTRAFWYQGDASPTVQRTDWGTSWSRSYQAGSHASVPLSKATGAYDAADMRTLFGALFGPGGTARAQLGTGNGLVYLRLEEEIERPSYSN